MKNAIEFLTVVILSFVALAAVGIVTMNVAPENRLIVFLIGLIVSSITTAFVMFVVTESIDSIKR